MSHTLELLVTISPDSDTDDVELDQLTTALRRRLGDLDVEQVDRVRGADVPAGAKPIDAIAVGALVVSLAPPILTAALSLLQEWLANRPVRRIKLTLDGDSIELTAASRDSQQRLIEAFLRRHEQ